MDLSSLPGEGVTTMYHKTSLYTSFPHDAKSSDLINFHSIMG